ncbi:hypothetical protein KAW04_01550 [Candidatus Bathyarchaeota archaeon]|nr:hypothetical protein [Candidatus Bathyarchaeota archaeon]
MQALRIIHVEDIKAEFTVFPKRHLTRSIYMESKDKSVISQEETMTTIPYAYVTTKIMFGDKSERDQDLCS